MYNPLESHWNAAKCVLRYLQGTIGYGIIYTNSSDVRLTRFTDLDWDGNVDDCRSITSYQFNIGSWWLHGEARNWTQFPFLELKHSIKPCAQQHVRQFGCEDFSRMLGKNKKMQKQSDATTRVQSNFLIIWCFTRTVNTLIHNSTLSGRKCNQNKFIWYIIIHVIMLQTFSLSLLAGLSLKYSRRF